MIRKIARHHCLHKESYQNSKLILSKDKLRTAILIIDKSLKDCDLAIPIIDKFCKDERIELNTYFVDLNKEATKVEGHNNIITRKDLNWYGKPVQKIDIKSHNDLAMIITNKDAFIFDYLSKCLNSQFKIISYAYSSDLLKGEASITIMQKENSSAVDIINMIIKTINQIKESR